MHPGNALVAALLELVFAVLNFYVWIIIISAILSWLVAFNVVNTRNRFVSMIGDMMFRLTEPAYRRLRRFIPAVGGLDLAPLALLFIIMFVQSFIRHLVIG